MSYERLRNASRWAAALLLTIALATARQAGAGDPSGIPSQAELDTLVTLHTDAGVFRLPYGYLAGRPPLDVVRKTEKWRYFSFAFWMPSGRYVRSDAVFQPAGFPKDDGVTPPAPGEFMVMLNQVQSKSSAVGSPPPIEQLSNFLGAGTIADFEFSRSGETLKIVSHYIKNTGIIKYFSIFYNLAENDRDSFLIGCFDQTAPMAPPLCRGEVALGALRVQATMLLPEHHILDATDALRESSKLLRMWADDGKAGGQ